MSLVAAASILLSTVPGTVKTTLYASVSDLRSPSTLSQPASLLFHMTCSAPLIFMTTVTVGAFISWLVSAEASAAEPVSVEAPSVVAESSSVPLSVSVLVVGELEDEQPTANEATKTSRRCVRCVLMVRV